MKYPVDLSQNVKFVIAFKSVLTIKMEEKLAKKRKISTLTHMRPWMCWYFSNELKRRYNKWKGPNIRKRNRKSSAYPYSTFSAVFGEYISCSNFVHRQMLVSYQSKEKVLFLYRRLMIFGLQSHLDFDAVFILVLNSNGNEVHEKKMKLLLK